MMTKQEYMKALRERKTELKRQLMIDRHDNVFVEPYDKRYRERRLINQILKLNRDENG